MIPEKITKEEKTLNFKGIRIILKPNETYEQAIARITSSNPTANGGGRKTREESKNSKSAIGETG